ncbi:Flp pilus assembly protein CpaB [Bradymonas sediminis]|uniref:Flp pilus assembly protein CpaB n=1 Tax=Bradymonas sediminis TaxID=1548548 RepID=A0A2Z4FG61_9DELT|nr:Flp pilus assembly protein CpaB [Bradymonas sediminis]AWV87920.1 Flp pilus assembly protein CpaB [Bradymonas sediminis]TDP62938.1 pilus assembly protein CpaB [Bradymonas sediminis]
MAKKKLLIAAVIVGAFAALLVYLFSQQQTEKLEAIKADEVEVIYSATDVPEGAALTKDNVTVKKVPRSNLPPNPIYQSEFSDYVGAPVNRRIQAGDMLLSSDIASVQSANTLSSRIPPGERAMSLPVDTISGVSGLLRPGDRVDILGTFPVAGEEQTIQDAGGGASTGYMTITLLQSVTLLAVGQEISGISAGGQDGSGRARGGYSTITPSVTISEAELLTIAQTRGELMILLRNSEDVEQGTIKSTTLRRVLEDLEVINTIRHTRQKTKRPAKKKEPEGPVIFRGSDR